MKSINKSLYILMLGTLVSVQGSMNASTWREWATVQAKQLHKHGSYAAGQLNEKLQQSVVTLTPYAQSLKNNVDKTVASMKNSSYGSKVNNWLTQQITRLHEYDAYATQQVHKTAETITPYAQNIKKNIDTFASKHTTAVPIAIGLTTGYIALRMLNKNQYRKYRLGKALYTLNSQHRKNTPSVILHALGAGLIGWDMAKMYTSASDDKMRSAHKKQESYNPLTTKVLLGLYATEKLLQNGQHYLPKLLRTSKK